MALETVTYISDLVATNPEAGDAVSTTDEHLQRIKSGLLTTFPSITGAVTATHTELNYVDGVTSAIQTQLDLKAALASPTLSGTPLAPTADPGTSTTQIATTAFVAASFAPKASPTFTGTVTMTGATAVTVPTPTASTHAVTKAYADALTAAGSGAWVLLKSTTASASSAVDFINGTDGVVISSTYDEYAIEIIDLYTSDATSVYLRTTTNASTFDAGASDYAWIGVDNTGTTLANAADSADNQIVVAGANTNSVTKRMRISIAFANPAGTSAYKIFNAHAVYDASGGQSTRQTSGYRVATADIDGVRLLPAAGTFTSGTFNLYGRVK